MKSRPIRASPKNLVAILDGTLWHLETPTWTHAAPYGVPSFDQMQHQEASLALTPQPADGGSSGRAGGGDSDAAASIVMCYVLDQAQFSVNPSGTTYYSFTPHEQPPKS